MPKKPSRDVYNQVCDMTANVNELEFPPILQQDKTQSLQIRGTSHLYINEKFMQAEGK